MYLLGVYCFFEIAPLGLLFPVVFVVYRPPINGRSMLACVLLMTLVWSPYIGYEVTRSGVDVRSFVTGAGAVDSNDPANSAGQSPSGVRRILTTMRIGILGNYMRGSEDDLRIGLVRCDGVRSRIRKLGVGDGSLSATSSQLRRSPIRPCACIGFWLCPCWRRGG